MRAAMILGAGPAGHELRARRGWLRSCSAVLWIGFILGASGAGYQSGITNFERYVWLPADLAIAAVALSRPEILSLALRNAVFVGWSMLAAASALWSLTPVVSFYHGIQLLLTVAAGLLLALHGGRRDVLKLILAALLLAAILSLALNIRIPDRTTGWQGAWMGAYSHKNTLGGMMGLLLITSVCLFLDRSMRLLAAPAIVLAALLLILSRSGTSLVAVTVALTPLPFILAGRLGRGLPGLLVGVLLFAGACGAAIVALAGVDPVAAALGGVGKEATLTGRTILWDFGLAAIADHPWLGHGFKGLWEDQGPLVRELRAVIGSDLSIFHNNFIEAAVAFGVAGPLLLAVGLTFALSRALSALASERSFAAGWPLMFTLYVACLTLAENPLLTNHSIFQVLLVFAAASGDAGRRGRVSR